MLALRAAAVVALGLGVFSVIDSWYHQEKKKLKGNGISLLNLRKKFQLVKTVYSNL